MLYQLNSNKTSNKIPIKIYQDIETTFLTSTYFAKPLIMILFISAFISTSEGCHYVQLRWPDLWAFEQIKNPDFKAHVN